jgi:hypothetical protein
MSSDPVPLHDAEEEQPPELPRFRYSLQSLFIGLAALCLLLAGMVAAGPIGAFVLLMAALSVAAHVFGAALGKSLRDGTSERLAQKPREVGPVVIPTSTEANWQFQPFEQSLIGIGLGAAVGALGGGSVLAWLNWAHATVANVSFGAIAFATLGGIGGFAVSSFWKAVRTSLDASLAASETKRATAAEPLASERSTQAECPSVSPTDLGGNCARSAGSDEKLLDSPAD